MLADVSRAELLMATVQKKISQKAIGLEFQLDRSIMSRQTSREACTETIRQLDSRAKVTDVDNDLETRFRRERVELVYVEGDCGAQNVGLCPSTDIRRDREVSFPSHHLDQLYFVIKVAQGLANDAGLNGPLVAKVARP